MRSIDIAGLFFSFLDGIERYNPIYHTHSLESDAEFCQFELQVYEGSKSLILLNPFKILEDWDIKDISTTIQLLKTAIQPAPLLSLKDKNR